jgi:hypothetical protein
MAKRCPSCGYSSIGPFIDNCPICAEPVRNVRSDGAGFWFSSLPPVLRWVILGMAGFLLSVVGCCGFGMWNLNSAMRDAGKTAEEAIAKAMAKAEADRQARTVVIEATDLLQEFGKNPAAADRKYAGMYLEISGVVERTGQERHETSFVVLTGGDQDAKLKVECFFDQFHRQDDGRIKRLDKGQLITVRGEYHGQVSNVQVRDCQLVEPRLPVRELAPR